MNRRRFLTVTGIGAASSPFLYSTLSRADRGSETIEEEFFTSEKGDNIDTPAVWHGEDEDLLLLTSSRA
ncbi:hypothetical protein [Natrinema altunense]|uniref:Uncharacterized protein n=1 Tax=Natrinema altunense (strain JCM 12890 / CGMCC 1.3731 / AJ2) TaxID=1227494 RepID=M0A015_NATA2|nr:hypothetical protein [Natrinema altunense]ELY90728.1 hypothetical protein C485_02771 [Natrinema altunense JCM 12890]